MQILPKNQFKIRKTNPINVKTKYFKNKTKNKKLWKKLI